MHQSTTPSFSQTIWPRWASRQFVTLSIVQILLTVTFAYSLSTEAIVMRQLRRWKRLWRRSLTRSHKSTSMGPSRICWNGRTSAWQPEEITSKGTKVSSVCDTMSWIYAHTCTHTCVCAPIHVCVCVYIYTPTHMCAHTHTHTPTYTHAHIHTYICGKMS